MNLILSKNGLSFKSAMRLLRFSKRTLKYEQGQSPEKNIREYFYYIDHQGMLFLDDSKMKNFTSCFKEKKFLVFFFKRIRLNTTGRYEKDFPFLSLCGRECNFIRCDDTPIVYTHVIEKDGKDVFCYGHAGDEMYRDFQADHIYMDTSTGRIYHPASESVGSIGLIQSKLAIELSRLFTFQNGEDKCPTHFSWKGNKYLLDTEWYKKLRHD